MFFSLMASRKDYDHHPPRDKPTSFSEMSEVRNSEVFENPASEATSAAFLLSYDEEGFGKNTSVS